MGGKTQQRVAGNVKPSSSGRIRDLLINKHGAGNMLTFSTLANANLQQAPINDVAINSNESDESGLKNLQSDPIASTTNNIQSNSTSSSRKPTLVMRRIGNRDYFTRVEVAQADDQISQLEKGVFKPNYDETGSPSSDKQTNTMLAGPASDNKDEDDKSSISKEQTVIEQIDAQVESVVEKEEIYDFDTTLDQLAQIRDSIGSAVTGSFEDLDDKMIANESELLRLLKILVTHFNNELSIMEWDIIVNCIFKWTTYISNSDDSLFDDIARVNFSINVLDFIYQLVLLAKSWREIEASEENFPMLQSLLDDWDNFHKSDVYQDLVILYYKLANMSEFKYEKARLLLESLSNIVLDVDPKQVLTNQNLAEYSSTPKTNELEPEFELPDNIRYCNIDEKKFKGFSATCSLLKSNYRVVIVSAHSILSRNMASICENAQASLVVADQDDIDAISFVPPTALVSILLSRDFIMSALLNDYHVGDISVTIDPKSDSYTCTLTYLLAWDLVIQFIVGTYKEMGHRMIHCLKKLGLIQRLLDNVFMLLPPLGERDSLNFRVESSEESTKNSHYQPWCIDSFLKSPLRTTVKRPVNEIELMALHVYFSVACHMPITVRKWYNNNSNKRLCNLVNEYTVKHISKVICSLEMETVYQKCQERANDDKINNLVIKARQNAREVYAIYTRDELRMELTIKLPINYPLGSVQIDGSKRVGVTDLKWRSWLLQLTTFLSHQNGPILDGIDLWTRNIDKKFEGVEKCMICFSILHSNYQLPKKKCQTCTKMFHNLCLFKWFESSGNSTCPLCRNSW